MTFRKTQTRHQPRDLTEQPRPVIHRVTSINNGREITRELVHPHHFIRDRFLDLTAIKDFLAPWVRDEVKKVLRDTGDC